MRTISLLAVAALAAMSVGCTTGEPLAATEVLNHRSCKGITAGITAVSYDDVANLRGSRLIGQTTEPTQSEVPADLILVAISKGDQPTPGYEFTLQGARLDGASAVISLAWKTPAPDAVLPQVITHPCIVVGLARETLSSVRAVDADGQLIGELDL